MGVEHCDDSIEAQLLQRAGQGDRGAFDELVARTAPAIWALVRRRTLGSGEAEDAVQECFLAAWRGAANFRGEGTVRSWLCALARNHAARTWRRRVGEPLHAVPLHELGGLAGWGDDPERAASAAEDRHRLFTALALLSAGDQEIVARCDLEGLSGPEAAAALGITSNAARVRLHRARLHLMVALREGGSNE